MFLLIFGQWLGRVYFLFISKRFYAVGDKILAFATAAVDSNNFNFILFIFAAASTFAAAATLAALALRCLWRRWGLVPGLAFALGLGLGLGGACAF